MKIVKTIRPTATTVAVACAQDRRIAVIAKLAPKFNAAVTAGFYSLFYVSRNLEMPEVGDFQILGSCSDVEL